MTVNYYKNLFLDNTPGGDVIMVNEGIRKIVMGLRPVDDDFMNVILTTLR